MNSFEIILGIDTATGSKGENQSISLQDISIGFQ